MEQLERTQRYLERIKNIYSGIFSSSGHDKESYDDDVISFFIHCYHVRDWIIHLNKIDIKSKQVDEYINSHLPLKICADFANGSKHCKLTRSLRTENQPHIIGKQRSSSTWLTGSGGGVHLESKYTISAGSEMYDALELAQECVSLWVNYTEQLQSAYNK